LGVTKRVGCPFGKKCVIFTAKGAEEEEEEEEDIKVLSYVHTSLIINYSPLAFSSFSLGGWSIIT